MEMGSFKREIDAHLELQRRNSRLERTMPIERYRESVEQGAPEADPPTEAVASSAPWDDPDSWWSDAEPETREPDWRS
jgi:hypothetical protein